jgi:hypothetical protein
MANEPNGPVFRWYSGGGQCSGCYFRSGALPLLIKQMPPIKGPTPPPVSPVPLPFPPPPPSTPAAAGARRHRFTVSAPLAPLLLIGFKLRGTIYAAPAPLFLGRGPPRRMPPAWGGDPTRHAFDFFWFFGYPSRLSRFAQR